MATSRLRSTPCAGNAVDLAACAAQSETSCTDAAYLLRACCAMAVLRDVVVVAQRGAGVYVRVGDAFVARCAYGSGDADVYGGSAGDADGEGRRRAVAWLVNCVEDWPDQLQKRALVLRNRANALDFGVLTGVCASGRVWSAGDLVWEDITSMLHDDERYRPADSLCKDSISPFDVRYLRMLYCYQTSSPTSKPTVHTLPVLRLPSAYARPTQCPVGVMMLYRAGDKNKQHGYHHPPDLLRDVRY
eukprot:3643073-Rhodomonas_salina.1